MQRKIHNKTLFVAALSVYLGLLIAGAPPHILAQQIGEQNNSTVGMNARPLKDFGVKFKRQVSSGQVDLDGSCSVLIKATFENGRLNNAKTFNKTGNVALCELGIEFVGALNDSGTLSSLSGLSQCASNEIAILLEIEKGDFSLTNSLLLESSQRASQGASTLNAYLQILKQRQADAVTQEVLQSLKIVAKDKEFIISARLPRAALDSLLKADEKAN